MSDLDTPPETVPLLADRVSVDFGGLHALTDVSLTVGPGEVVGLIGGNGAGKTTFMDCVSGSVRPKAGSSIRAFGNELVGMASDLRAYIDVGRSYQNAVLFPGLTVREALLVAVERHHPTNVLSGMFGLPGARRAEATKSSLVEDLITTMGLGRYQDNLIRELSTGTRRVVDIASILAQRPKLLLLDEPTAGLAQRETEAFGPLLARVRETLDCAILVIEHDIVLISSICDRVYALEAGRIIAEGDPDTVRQDPKVVAAYLGTDEAAIARSGAQPSPTPVRSNGHHDHSDGGQQPNGRRRQPLHAGPALESMTRSELLVQARAADITGRSNMRKYELVHALMHHESARLRASR